ncbi:uncharacterized protein LOC104266210 isoform X2 [Ciona intestinalis]
MVTWSKLFLLRSVCVAVTALVTTRNHKNEKSGQFEELVRALDNLNSSFHQGRQLERFIGHDEVLNNSKNGHDVATNADTHGHGVIKALDFYNDLRDNMTGNSKQLVDLKLQLYEDLLEIEEKIQSIEHELSDSAVSMKEGELEELIKRRISESTGQLNEILFRTKSLLKIEPFARLFGINASSLNNTTKSGNKDIEYMRLKLGVFGNSIRTSSNQAEMIKMSGKMRENEKKNVKHENHLQELESLVERRFSMLASNYTNVLMDINALHDKFVNLTDQDEEHEQRLDLLHIEQKQIENDNKWNKTQEEIFSMERNFHEWKKRVTEKAENDTLLVVARVEQVNASVHQLGENLNNQILLKKRTTEILVQHVSETAHEKFTHLEQLFQALENKTNLQNSLTNERFDDLVLEIGNSFGEQEEKSAEIRRKFDEKLRNISVVIQTEANISRSNYNDVKQWAHEGLEKMNIEIVNLDRNQSKMEEHLLDVETLGQLNEGKIFQMTQDMLNSYVERRLEAEMLEADLQRLNSTFGSLLTAHGELTSRVSKMNSNLTEDLHRLLLEDTKLNTTLQDVGRKFDTELWILDTMTKTLEREAIALSENVASLKEDFEQANVTIEQELEQLSQSFNETALKAEEKLNETQRTIAEVEAQLHGKIDVLRRNVAEGNELVQATMVTLNETLSQKIGDHSLGHEKEITKLAQSGKVMKKIYVKQAKQILSVLSKQDKLESEMSSEKQNRSEENEARKMEMKRLEAETEEGMADLRETLQQVGGRFEQKHNVTIGMVEEIRSNVSSVNVTLMQHKMDTKVKIEHLKDSSRLNMDGINEAANERENIRSLIEKLEREFKDEIKVKANRSEIKQVIKDLNETARQNDRSFAMLEELIEDIVKDDMEEIKEELQNITDNVFNLEKGHEEMLDQHTDTLNATKKMVVGLAGQIVEMKTYQKKQDAKVNATILDVRRNLNETNQSVLGHDVKLNKTIESLAIKEVQLGETIDEMRGELERNLSSVRLKVRNNFQTLDELSSKMMNLSSSEELHALEREVSALKASKGDMLANLSRMSNDTVGLRQELEDFKETTAEVRLKDISGIQEVVGVLEQEVADHRLEDTDALERLEEENIRRLRVLEDKIVNATNKNVGRLSKEVVGLQNWVQESWDLSESVKVENAEMKSELEMNASELGKLEKAVAIVIANISSVKEKQRGLLNEMTKNAMDESKHQELETMVKSLAEDVDTLKVDLENSTRGNDRLHEEIKRWCDEKQQEIKRSQTETFKTYEKKLENDREKFDILNDTVAGLEMSLQTSMEQNEGVQQELKQWFEQEQHKLMENVTEGLKMFKQVSKENRNKLDILNKSVEAFKGNLENSTEENEQLHKELKQEKKEQEIIRNVTKSLELYNENFNEDVSNQLELLNEMVEALKLSLENSTKDNGHLYEELKQLLETKEQEIIRNVTDSFKIFEENLKEDEENELEILYEEVEALKLHLENSTKGMKRDYQELKQWWIQEEGRIMRNITNGSELNKRNLEMYETRLDRLNETVAVLMSKSNDGVKDLNSSIVDRMEELRLSMNSRINRAKLEVNETASRNKELARLIQNVRLEGDDVSSDVTDLKEEIKLLRNQDLQIRNDSKILNFNFQRDINERIGNRSEEVFESLRSEFEELNQTCSLCRRVVRRKVKVEKPGTTESNPAPTKAKTSNETLETLREKILKLSRKLDVYKDGTETRLVKLETHANNETTWRRNTTSRLLNFELTLEKLDSKDLHHENRTLTMLDHVQIIQNDIERLRTELESKDNSDDIAQMSDRAEALESFLSMIMMELTNTKENINEALLQIEAVKSQSGNAEDPTLIKSVKEELGKLRAEFDETKALEDEVRRMSQRMNGIEDIVASQQQLLRHLNK